MNVDHTSGIVMIFLIYMCIAIILCIKNEANFTRICKIATVSTNTKEKICFQPGFVQATCLVNL